MGGGHDDAQTDSKINSRRAEGKKSSVSPLLLFCTLTLPRGQIGTTREHVTPLTTATSWRRFVLFSREASVIRRDSLLFGSTGTDEGWSAKRGEMSWLISLLQAQNLRGKGKKRECIRDFWPASGKRAILHREQQKNIYMLTEFLIS